MHCRISIPALTALALACSLNASCGATEQETTLARGDTTQPGATEEAVASPRAADGRATSESGSAARRRTRVLEMYDPGFRYSGPARRDKAVERVAGRAPDGIRIDDETQVPTPFMPPPSVAPAQEERSTWLDILYDRDGKDNGELAGGDDPFERLWGGTEDASQDGSSLLDPYEQMLSSYRELMAAEEQKVEQQLRGDPMEADPFASLREVDPSFDRSAASADEFEPALASLLQQASRGMDPNVLEQLSSQDLMALVNEPFSPTIGGPDDGDEFETDSWDPSAWRGLLSGGGELDAAAEPGQADAAADAWQRPILIRRDADDNRDFAGLGALRRNLMQVHFDEPEEMTSAFAPTSIHAGWQAETEQMEGFGTTLDPTGDAAADRFSAHERLGDPLHQAGRLDPRDVQPNAFSLDPDESLLGRIGGSESQRLDPLFGDSERGGAVERRTIYDPRAPADSFGQRDRFGNRDWGELGR